MQQRRSVAYPLTWELPAACVTVLALVMILGVHLGRAAACWLSGRGLVWASRSELIRSLGGILTGNAGAGVAQPVVGITPAVLASSLVLTEAVGLAFAGWAAWSVWVRWGSAALKGVASASEAEGLLGRSRLRRVRRIIRPDLYRRGSRDKGLLPGGRAS